MILSSVFATLRQSLFTFSQQLRFASSEVITAWFKISESTARNANISVICEHFAQAVVRQFGKSLMHIRKSRGPIMLPCGTPQLNSLAFDRAPLTLHF